MRKYLYTFLPLAALWAAPALAEICYEERVTTGLQCSESSSSSADFTTGCTFGPRIEKVEVPCGRWVNVFSETRLGESGASVTHAQACAVHGLKPSSFQGKTCASGERRPTVGNGWQYINYRYGKKGDGNGGDGGDRIEVINGATHYTIEDPRGRFGPVVGSMCYDYSMKKKNHTKQDAVIAVFCQ